MTKKEKSRASEIDKYVVRLPDGMRSDVEKLAKECGISMNTAIVEAIQIHLTIKEREKLLLNALQERLPLGSAKNSRAPDDGRDYLDGLPEGYD